MDSFEELGLSPELVEALASEGIERPNALQEAATPVLRRGNNVLLAAGPGAGTLVTWGPAVLERIDLEATSPRALVLTATAETAQRLAESLQRLAGATGHTVAALGSPWVLPGRAHVLFGTPEGVLDAVRGDGIDLSLVEILVVDQADRIERLGGLPRVEETLSFIAKDGQRVVTALPVTPAIDDFVERHLRRAMTLPARPADPATAASVPSRGSLHYRVIPEPKEEGVLATVAQILATDVRHVLLFCRSEDRAADLGDYLNLHGYVAGAPGDAAIPIWLGVDELEARHAAEGVEDVTVVSCDVPADPDSLDRRHGLAGSGTVLVLPREMAHLRDVARRTGYTLTSSPLPPRGGDENTRFREMIAKAVEDEDAAPYMLLLEPLFERYDPAEVAAVLAALLRKKVPSVPAQQPAAPQRSAGRAAPQAFVRLFLSVGERDGLAAKDLLGAITGEADVPGGKIGKIDIRESHSVVEVQEEIAQKIISALNGTTIRGRAVRADFDRGRPKPGGPRGAPPRGRPPRRS